MTEETLDKYKDVNFDDVSTVVELAEKFASGPYKDNGSTDTKECYAGIITQYENAERNNYENAAQVFYVDRTKMGPPDHIVELKTMWFDEDGNKTARPVRKTNE